MTQHTPRPRPRSTSARVHIADKTAGAIISVGGLAVVASALAICIYLIVVAGRLFLPGEVGAPVSVALAPGPAAGAQTMLLPDESLSSAALVDEEGVARLVHLPSGAVVSTRRLAPEGRSVAAIVRRPGSAAIGLDDGSVMLGRIEITTRFLAEVESAADALSGLAPGRSTPMGESVVTLTPVGQFRAAALEVDLAAPAPLAEGAGAVRLIDYFSGAGREFLVALREDGTAVFEKVRRTRPLGGGPPKVVLTSHRLPFAPPEGSAPMPDWLFVTGDGASALMIWADGVCQRYAIGEPAAAALAETVRLVEPGRRVASVAMLIGARTLAVADDAGGVSGWFAARDRTATTPDGLRFVRAHTLPSQGEAVVSLSTSQRDRLFVSASGDAALVRHMTSHKTVGRARPPAEAGPILLAALAPKNDAVVALTGAGRLVVWPLDPGHPDATFASLFLPVWYEGEPAPAHVYQSSSGEDASEPKLGLTPLIYGTLKATIYAMLIATPIAILGALYTSEFLGRRVRAAVKPAIETLASLPSVALGFIAAIVLAPVVAAWLPSILLAFAVVPVGVLLAAHLVQLMPTGAIVRISPAARLGLIALTAVASALACAPLGPALERALFVGPGVDSLRDWLNTGLGPAWPGWLLLSFPAAALVVRLFTSRVVDPRVSRLEASATQTSAAVIELIKFALSLVAAAALAVLVARGLEALDFDPRRSIFGPYDQRNTLVVSLAMAVAIVPLIFTISEDALAAVPEQLRSASLAAGATRWQTATRVVLPVAASGVFSAVMIGLGRAAGETMIVLMATGNTPVMSASLFDGLRSLSANIAVELPEAPKDSTHYRTLFLCGLLLFALTFVVNTAAEMMRRRARRRSAAL